jgi:hypothetical protein
VASERILDLLRAPVDPDEVAEIRELWKVHSIAEDNRDLPGLISTLTEDCVYTVAGTGARWEGHEGAARFYTELLTAFPDIHFDLDYIVIGPQGVCEEAVVTATHEGRWLEHEPPASGSSGGTRSSFPGTGARKFKGEMVYTDLAWTEDGRGPRRRLPRDVGLGADGPARDSATLIRRGGTAARRLRRGTQRQLSARRRPDRPGGRLPDALPCDHYLGLPGC